MYKIGDLLDARLVAQDSIRVREHGIGGLTDDGVLKNELVFSYEPRAASAHDDLAVHQLGQQIASTVNADAS